MDFDCPMGLSMLRAKLCTDSKTSSYHVVQMSWLAQDARIMQSELEQQEDCFYTPYGYFSG